MVSTRRLIVIYCPELSFFENSSSEKFLIVKARVTFLVKVLPLQNVTLNFKLGHSVFFRLRSTPWYFRIVLIIAGIRLPFVAKS